MLRTIALTLLVVPSGPTAPQSLLIGRSVLRTSLLYAPRYARRSFLVRTTGPTAPSYSLVSRSSLRSSLLPRSYYGAYGPFVLTRQSLLASSEGNKSPGEVPPAPSPEPGLDWWPSLAEELRSSECSTPRRSALLTTRRTGLRPVLLVTYVAQSGGTTSHPPSL